MRLHGEVTVRERSVKGMEGRISGKSHLGSCLEAEEYQDYQLVVTGHSLGAGAAAILAFLLREKYPGRQVSLSYRINIFNKMF